MIKFKLKNKRIRLYKLIMVYIISILLIYLISVCLILFIRFNNSDSEKFNSITRQEALDRGMSIINYTWNYTRVDSSEGVILPYYLKGDGKYIGIPYCYGGQFSLDYSNVNGVSSFGEAVKSAYVPGNINTSQGYVKNSAGMDCSGFVNSVFNIREKTSTTNMDKYFKEIDLNRIKSMDILNSKGNHVYIYLGKVEDGGVMILESTSNGSKKYKDKTVVNYKTKEQFQKDIDSRGYKVMRYKGIKGSTVQDIFDRYEFNNEERYAKSIDCNQWVNSRVDYLEDVDYYVIDLRQGDSYINIDKLDSELTISVKNNSDEEIKIDKEGKYKLNYKGKVYIKIFNIGSKIGKMEYKFNVLAK